MGWEHVIPEFMKRIRILSNELTLKNINFPIQGTGEETRAFCFIDDAIEGILKCQENGDDGEIYHLGVEELESIKSLALKVGKLTNINLNLEFKEKMLGSTSKRCPDISKLKKIGYMPKFDLEEGLKKSWEWYSNAKIPNKL